MNLNPFDVEGLRHTYASSGDTKAFRETYSSQYPAITDKNTPDHWEELLEDIPDIADPMTQDRVLHTAHMLHPRKKVTLCCDIGIGNGWVEQRADQLHPKAFMWTGVDITPINLKRLEKKLHGTMLQGSILDLPAQLNQLSFDYVLLLEVLEHIPHVQTFEALKNLISLMKPDGECIISVPVYEDLEEKISAGTNYSHHVRRYTPRILMMELQLAGLEVIEQRRLYAFRRFYRLKSWIARITGLRQPNVVIVRARKART